MDYQAVVNAAIKAGVSEKELYHVASELRKKGVDVELNLGRNPNRNNICSYGGNSGGGRLGAIAKSIYNREVLV